MEHRVKSFKFASDPAALVGWAFVPAKGSRLGTWSLVRISVGAAFSRDKLSGNSKSEIRNPQSLSPLLCTLSPAPLLTCLGEPSIDNDSRPSSL